MNPLEVNPVTINNYKQNKPSLIVMDLQEHFGVPPDATWKILLARGVCKWMAVRKLLIDYKHELKGKTTQLIDQMKAARKLKNKQKAAYLKGYLAATVEHRKRIRRLSRLQRWIIPSESPSEAPPDWFNMETLSEYFRTTANGGINPEKYRRAQEHIKLLREELRELCPQQRRSIGRVVGPRQEVVEPGENCYCDKNYVCEPCRKSILRAQGP